jgi:hypothetical protein
VTEAKDRSRPPLVLCFNQHSKDRADFSNQVLDDSGTDFIDSVAPQEFRPESVVKFFVSNNSPPVSPMHNPTNTAGPLQPPQKNLDPFSCCTFRTAVPWPDITHPLMHLTIPLKTLTDEQRKHLRGKTQISHSPPPNSDKCKLNYYGC